MSVKSNNLSDSSRRHTYLKNKLRARAQALDSNSKTQFEGGDSEDEDDDRNIMSGVPKEFILDTQSM